jgi:hypothetical protein
MELLSLFNSHASVSTLPFAFVVCTEKTVSSTFSLIHMCVYILKFWSEYSKLRAGIQSKHDFSVTDDIFPLVSDL